MGNWKELSVKFNELNQKIFLSYNINELSDYEKRKIIFNYLCDNLEYDYEYLDRIIKIEKKEIEDTYRNPCKEVESVLINNKGVCNGIAQVYRILLELNNILSLCVICDNGMEVGHQLNLVYDKDHNIYSFDDITSVIVNLDTREKLFDYDKEYAKRINQGNKFITETNEWIFLPAEYVDAILGKENIMKANFDDGLNINLPSNIKSIKNNFYSKR